MRGGGGGGHLQRRMQRTDGLGEVVEVEIPHPLHQRPVAVEEHVDLDVAKADDDGAVPTAVLHSPAVHVLGQRLKDPKRGDPKRAGLNPGLARPPMTGIGMFGETS